jgi:hypothetical protein
MDDQPAWVPAFEDIMAAAALVFEQSKRAEGDVFTYTHIAKNADDPPLWQEQAERAREHARLLNRAAAILDWVGRRSDRLHLLTKPYDRGRRR